MNTIDVAVLPDQPPPAEFEIIPLTVPETGRLLSHPPPPGSARQWLDWRRRHQARSRWYHKRTRLAGTTVPVRDLIMVHAGEARSRAW